MSSTHATSHSACHSLDFESHAGGGFSLPNEHTFKGLKLLSTLIIIPEHQEYFHYCSPVIIFKSDAL